MRARAGVRKPRSGKKDPAGAPPAPAVTAQEPAAPASPLAPGVLRTLVDIGDALTAGLMRALLHRLTARACEHCGYEGATSQDLALVHRVLTDNEFARLREAARSEANAGGVKPITIDLPFTIDHPFEEIPALPERTA